MSAMNFEILFDGEVVVSDDSPGNITGTADFQGGDTIRCTVNGVTNTFVAHQDNLGGYFGNEYVMTSSAGEDTGYDYYFGSVTLGAHMIEMYARNSGTYTVKLEVCRAILPEYSYNGMILGALPPDWDKETYPYAFIRIYEKTRYIFYAYPSLPTATEPDSNGYTLIWEKGTGYQTTECYPSLSLWWEDIKSGTATVVGYRFKHEEIIWANFDVLNEDGTLYLAASEPVPVTTTPLDPAAMYLGWLMGRRIAGQRKVTP